MPKNSEISVKDIKDLALRYFKDSNPLNFKTSNVNRPSPDGFLAYCYVMALSDVLCSKGLIEEPLELKW